MARQRGRRVSEWKGGVGCRPLWGPRPSRALTPGLEGVGGNYQHAPRSVVSGAGDGTRRHFLIRRAHVLAGRTPAAGAARQLRGQSAFYAAPFTPTTALLLP